MNMEQSGAGYPRTPGRDVSFVDNPRPLELLPVVIKSPPRSPGAANIMEPLEATANGSVTEVAEVRSSSPVICAICLSRCADKCFSDRCLHEFCFTCLLQWSKVKPECPLCKQGFQSIIHNVRSVHDYEEYRVLPEQSVLNDMHLPLPYQDNSTHRRFRYRATFTLERHEEEALHSFFLGHPGFLLYRHQSRNSNLRSHHTYTTRSRSDAVVYRQILYQDDLWVLPLPDTSTGRFRETSPEFYRSNPAQLHRLGPWLDRELEALHIGSSELSSQIIIGQIMDLLPLYHIRSRQFRARMESYFGIHFDHFIHEFFEFARSPYDIVGYDQSIHYGSRPVQIATEYITSGDSDNDSDVQIVNSESPNSRMNLFNYSIRSPEASEDVMFVQEEPSTSHRPTLGVDSVVVIEDDNDAHPGSTSSFEPIIPIETIRHSDSDNDECVITGFVKPPHLQTPEVVDLSTDDETLSVNQNLGSLIDTSTGEPIPSTSSGRRTRARTLTNQCADSTSEDEFKLFQDYPELASQRRRQYSSDDVYTPPKASKNRTRKTNRHRKSRRKFTRISTFSTSEDEEWDTADKQNSSVGAINSFSLEKKTDKPVVSSEPIASTSTSSGVTQPPIKDKQGKGKATKKVAKKRKRTSASVCTDSNSETTVKKLKSVVIKKVNEHWEVMDKTPNNHMQSIENFTIFRNSNDCSYNVGSSYYNSPVDTSTAVNYESDSSMTINVENLDNSSMSVKVDSSDDTEFCVGENFVKRVFSDSETNSTNTDVNVDETSTD